MNKQVPLCDAPMGLVMLNYNNKILTNSQKVILFLTKDNDGRLEFYNTKGEKLSIFNLFDKDVDMHNVMVTPIGDEISIITMPDTTSDDTYRYILDHIDIPKGEYYELTKRLSIDSFYKEINSSIRKFVKRIGRITTSAEMLHLFNIKYDYEKIRYIMTKSSKYGAIHSFETTSLFDKCEAVSFNFDLSQSDWLIGMSRRSNGENLDYYTINDLKEDYHLYQTYQALESK